MNIEVLKSEMKSALQHMGESDHLLDRCDACREFQAAIRHARELGYRVSGMQMTNGVIEVEFGQQQSSITLLAA